GNWHREVVQLREGLRLHLPVRWSRRVRALQRDRGRGIQEPGGEPAGRVRRDAGTEGSAGGERSSGKLIHPIERRGAATEAWRPLARLAASLSCRAPGVEARARPPSRG